MTDVLNAVIPAGESLSQAVALEGEVIGLMLPDSWTPATLTFQVSMDGVSFMDMYNEGGEEIQIPAASGLYIVFSPANFMGASYVKFRSGLCDAGVAQEAERVIGLVVERTRKKMLLVRWKEEAE